MDRVKAATAGWSKKFLSPGGKEVLLKAVTLALPVYCMNLFKLPKSFCDELNGALARFWWSKGGDTKGMHWFAWNRLSLPKKEGGLGFKDLEGFNLATLGKQVWRILQTPSCLMARVLKARYFHDTNILNARIGKKASYVWKSILQGRDLLRKGLRFVIGNGSLVHAWLDPWLPISPPRPPRRMDDAPENLKVADLFNATRTGWDAEKIQRFVHQDDVARVLAIKLCHSAQEDYLGWHYNRDGVYSVKSGYWLATHVNPQEIPIPPPGDILLKNSIWKMKTASKLQHFCWKILSGSLPVGQNLRRRHITGPDLCLRCCRAEETCQHIFFQCSYAQAVWRGSGIPSMAIHQPGSTIKDNIQMMLAATSQSTVPYLKQLPFWILWRLWKSRNLLLYQQKNITWMRTLALATQDAKDWTEAQAYGKQITTSAIGSLPQSPSNWIVPPQGWVKCNFDGSHQQGHTSTAGWLVRDPQGNFLSAAHARGPHILTSSAESELQGLLMAMQFCWSKGYRKVIFQGDNSEVINLTKGITRNFGLYNWIRDIQVWADKFEAVRFEWTRRQYNTPADILAKLSLPDNVNFQCFTKIPNVIRHSMYSDITFN